MSARLQAQVDIEVPFHDVDAMDVAWHGHYMKYFEIARCRLLQRFDYDYPQMRESGFIWPVVESKLRYLRPARYGQHLRVNAELTEYETRLKISYVIRDAKSGECLTKGHTIQVAVAMATGELQYVSPRALTQKVEKCLAN